MDLNGRRLPKPKARASQLRFFGTGMLILFGLAVYPTIISPMLNPESWQQFRKKYPPPTDTRF